MKSIVKITLISLTLIVFNCKNNNTNLEYKFADKPASIACNTPNEKLYLEALYSFEEDIFNFYVKNNRSSNRASSLTYAYNQFTRNAVYGKVRYEGIVSKHTLAVFEALKNDNTLWDENNTKSHLSYSSPLIKCIGENIADKNLKTTFNALLSINDLSPKLFGAPLVSNYRSAISDKYLATYIAFDLYYSRLFDIDLSNITFPEKPETKVDFNNVPPPSHDPNAHAGHNH
ncbi:hypothetical protein N1F78_03150 [Seonamhaeicola sp. MEBiC1930]|uniref:hypothetical protein n=1 Tax=Seonamhaeicola sp. MEBiC01930 TaxID=2976768 RepID=UPI00324467A5